MPESRRDRLRVDLIRLRMRASMGRRPIGKEIGASHTTVERIEKGETLPSMKYVRLWLDAVDAEGVLEPGERQRILDLAESVHAETRGWSDLLGVEGHAQREVAQREATATRVRNFQPSMFPGLLQTPEYARAWFELGRTRDVEAAVAGRIARQQALSDPHRRWEFIVSEHALAWPLGGQDTLRLQRARSRSLAELPTVELAVLPGQTVPRAMAWHNFTLWDSPDGRYVLAELIDGQHEVIEGEDVALFEAVWDALWAASLHGPEALELLA